MGEGLELSGSRAVVAGEGESAVAQTVDGEVRSAGGLAATLSQSSR